MGVDPKTDPKGFEEAKRQLSEYLRFLRQLERLRDPETDESILDEIANTFQNIRSRRVKPRYRSKGPVDIDHGTRLHGSSIAQGVADILFGSDNPYMFEFDAKHEKIAELTGRFELTVVADGSGSMDEDG